MRTINELENQWPVGELVNFAGVVVADPSGPHQSRLQCMRSYCRVKLSPWTDMLINR